MATSSIRLSTISSPLPLRIPQSCSFLGHSLKPSVARFSSRGQIGLQIRSKKIDFWQLLGGRGLPGGEESLKLQEKQKILLGSSSSKVEENALEEPADVTPVSNASGSDSEVRSFEKELMGLAGGFPGGETGLQKFIKENPPPPKGKASDQIGAKWSEQLAKLGVKPRAPPPPLLMPGMTVIVKNSQHPYYMYGGIVQRVTDGCAGVLFEGGNWDKLITFELGDLERTSKGPPMVNPKSAVLEETTAS